ncbi:TraR/DksA family transcriptional regulator [Knoellia sp. CPCC 206450]|uniref:TraR/DksA family transcriptional regulator n=1 Tax=Knoellia tibetensis TaxID=3404798 RepID=UPI003B43C313
MVGTRDALEDDRRVTLDRLAALTGDFDRIVEASRDSNADDEHDPEGATIAFERSQVDALAQQARAHLDEVDAALARVDDGTYGRCERCGGEIAAARLDARPTARTCVTCPPR